MGQYSRIMECRCGVTVEDFGTWRVDYLTGSAHSCADSVMGSVNDMVRQALAGASDLDEWIAEGIEVWMELRVRATKGNR